MLLPTAFFMSRRLAALFLLFSFSFLIALYFGDVLFTGQLMIERDLPIFFFPQIKLWVEAVRSGELPLWNPYSYCGQPLLASLQAGVLYPVNALLMVLPLEWGFNLTLVIHFFLAGWFVYLFCRELGGSRTAGILSCLSFSLGGFLISIHNVQNTLQSAAWTPLFWFFLLRAFRYPGWRYPVLSAGIALVQFLGGGVEVFLLTQGMAVFGALYPRSILPGVGFLPLPIRCLKLGAIYLLFLGLGAVQILPFWEMISLSVRKAGFSYVAATTWSLTWKDLLYIFLPDFFWRGVEYYRIDQNYLKSIYLGIIPVLMTFFFFQKARVGRGWYAIFLIFFLLLALGRHTQLYRIFYDFVPGFQMIRYPAKGFFLVNLLLCLLCGLGWDVFIRSLGEDPRGKSPGLKRASFLAALVLAGLLLVLQLYRPDLLGFLESRYPISSARPWAANLHNLERLAFFSLLAFIFLIFLADGKIKRNWAGALWILLLTLDLFLANWGYYRRVPVRDFYATSPNMELVLSDPDRGRIYVDPRMQKVEVPKQVDMVELTRLVLKENFYLDYPLIQTYHPYQDLLTLLEEKGFAPEAVDLLSIMRVKYVLSPRPVVDPAWRLLRTGESYVLPREGPRSSGEPRAYEAVSAHLYENRKVLPWAFLVSHYIVAPNGQLRIDLLQNKGFDPSRCLVLEERPTASSPGKGPIPDRDRVRMVSRGLNRMELEVFCQGPRLLFVSETYYPGWKVEVNGREERIYRANHAFRAVTLGPGRHHLLWEYRPNSLLWGAGISAFSLLVLVGSLVFHGLRKKRTPN